MEDPSTVGADSAESGAPLPVSAVDAFYSVAQKALQDEGRRLEEVLTIANEVREAKRAFEAEKLAMEEAEEAALAALCATRLQKKRADSNRCVAAVPQTDFAHTPVEETADRRADSTAVCRGSRGLPRRRVPRMELMQFSDLCNAVVKSLWTSVASPTERRHKKALGSAKLRCATAPPVTGPRSWGKYAMACALPPIAAAAAARPMTADTEVAAAQEESPRSHALPLAAQRVSCAEGQSREEAERAPMHTAAHEPVTEDKSTVAVQRRSSPSVPELHDVHTPPCEVLCESESGQRVVQVSFSSPNPPVAYPDGPRGEPDAVPQTAPNPTADRFRPFASATDLDERPPAAVTLPSLPARARDGFANAPSPLRRSMMYLPADMSFNMSYTAVVPMCNMKKRPVLPAVPPEAGRRSSATPGRPSVRESVPSVDFGAPVPEAEDGAGLTAVSRSQESLHGVVMDALIDERDGLEGLVDALEAALEVKEALRSASHGAAPDSDEDSL